ncbi:MAG: hypothetical protein EA397_17070 [Deltaproteobacteria bacterium]|nr:MAG: hypothetical protein EA397_17070 [Deltaproteobacteria bacterium]
MSAILFFLALAFAQDPEPPLDQGALDEDQTSEPSVSTVIRQVEARRAQPHTLGDHVFVMPLRVDTPFVVRQFTFRQGGGLVFVPDMRVDGYDEPFDLLLGGAIETMRVDGALRPWLGVYGEVGGELVTGLNPDSAFFRGARGGLAWEAGGVVRLVRDEQRRFQLGFRALARGQHGLSVEPAELVSALIADREATFQSVLDGDLARLLLVQQRAILGGGSLAAAYAISPRFGLLASMRSTAGSRHRSWFDGQTEQISRSPLGTLAIGAAFDADLRPIPLDLQLEYRYRVEGEGGGEDSLYSGLQSRHFGGFGAYYGGRQDVQLGLHLATLLLGAGAIRERWAQIEMVLRISL